MAFTPQDDDGSVDNANSHVTVEEFYAYFTDRGKDYTDTTTYPTSSVQAALIRATDYQNSQYKWVGEPKSSTQGTAWPRYYVYDFSYNLIDVIPVQVKQDCYELAAYMLDNAVTTLLDDITGEATGIKSTRVKADVIEKQIEYFGKIEYNSLVVGNARNAINSGYLVCKSGIYL